MTTNSENINLDNNIAENNNNLAENNNFTTNDNPQEMTTLEKIINVINMLRPYINADGGDIEFIKYEDKYVYVKFHGACASCGSIDYTIKDVLFNAIKDDVPEVEGVINVAI